MENDNFSLWIVFMILFIPLFVILLDDYCNNREDKCMPEEYVSIEEWLNE